ncbi:MAG TPA: DUF1580 domain-containing protein [Lacipirellulaceae bacterium]|nr:DUF1580 domain-containing protein [Lacipirellulaceae bacterium]
MSDLLSETRVSLTELARQEGVAVSTAWRWAARGVRGARLESIAVGGKRYTSLEAFARFVEATTRAAQSDRSTVDARPAPSRRTAVAQAIEAMKAMGA